jgi:hypothetical protein
MGIEASRNQVVRQFGNLRARKNLVGTIATTDTIAAALNPEGTWNHFEIIARGPVMMHFINGQLTSVLIDDDPASSNNWSGLFGFRNREHHQVRSEERLCPQAELGPSTCARAIGLPPSA